jgi:hypothetical protein
LYAAQDEYISRQKIFVNKLFADGKYFDCIAETRRLINQDITAEEKNNFNYFLESNYFLGGQYKTVIFNINKKPYASEYIPYVFLLSQSYSRLNNNKAAYDELKNIKYHDVGEQYRDDLFLRKIEIMLSGSRYDDIVKEIEVYKEYTAVSIENVKLDIMKYKEINYRSKWLSVSLSSVVPGSGQVYSGRYLDGVISLLSVACTSYGAWYFNKSGDMPLSMTSGFFAALFYCGNIYGAYNSAERSGIDADQKFRSEFTRKYIPDYNPMIYFNFERNFK